MKEILLKFFSFFYIVIFFLNFFLLKISKYSGKYKSVDVAYTEWEMYHSYSIIFSIVMNFLLHIDCICE
jgi:hypothetical protein